MRLKVSEARTTLQRHQDELSGILTEAEAAFAEPAATRTMALAVLRWRMTRALRAYELTKHHQIFDPQIATGEPKQRQLAQGMKERCIAIGKRFEQHVLRWSAGGIESAWNDYEHDALELIAVLRAHLARETRELDQLLSSADTRRPPAGEGAKLSSERN